MRKVLFCLTATLLTAPLAAPTFAQTRRNQPAARPAAVAAQGTQRVLGSLPASDGVVLVDAKRLMTEALPRMYSSNASELARINSEIDKFKTRTGLDARQFERIAVGTSYRETPSGGTSLDTVALVQGAFNSAALIDSARKASAVKSREEKHGGRSIHVFTLNEDVKLLGLFNLRVTDLAVAALDANTVALGKLERVRAALDATGAGGVRVSPDIAALATRNPSALVGLGGNVPRSAFAGMQFPSEQLARSANSIRQLYGSVATSEAGFQTEAVLRTETAAEARSLGDTITGLKGLAGGLIGFRYQEPKAGLLRGVITATRVAAAGNEVQITLDLKQDGLAALLEAF